MEPEKKVAKPTETAQVLQFKLSTGKVVQFDQKLPLVGGSAPKGLTEAEALELFQQMDSPDQF